MNRIVRPNYPASKLPEDLRGSVDPAARVTVTVATEPASELSKPEHVLSLEEIFALRRPPYRTKEEIDAEIRRQRDEWDH